MNIPSMKKDIINGFVSVSKLGKREFNGITIDFTGNQLIIFASGCIIVGTPVEDDSEQKVPEDGALTIPLTSLTVNCAAESYRKENNVQGALPGNDGCLILKDATIRYTNDFTVQISEIAVFYDQILGISIGE